MLSTPGCWALYGSVLALRSELGVGGTQRVIDSYAAQHATNSDRRNRQSVAVHLMSLCASIEHAADAQWLHRVIGLWTHLDYPLLVPRPATFAVTVSDVVTVGPSAWTAAADAWALATWQAWSEHHKSIRSWLRVAMTDRRPDGPSG
jgi:Family of unknown function (DUF5946)